MAHLREMALGAVEHVRDFAMSAVEMVADVADWFTGLAQVDDTGLREAREEIREREVAHEEREIADPVAQLDAREMEREQEREAVRAQEREMGLGRARERSHGLELGS